MKTRPIIISGVLLITLSIILTSFVSKAKPNRAGTEEYAMVDVRSYGKTKFIHVSKSNQPTTEKEWEKGESNDNNPIIITLDKLNEEGFELLSVSSDFHPSNGTQSQTFMLVKKLK